MTFPLHIIPLTTTTNNNTDTRNTNNLYYYYLKSAFSVIGNNITFLYLLLVYLLYP